MNTFILKCKTHYLKKKKQRIFYNKSNKHLKHWRFIGVNDVKKLKIHLQIYRAETILKKI